MPPDGAGLSPARSAFRSETVLQVQYTQENEAYDALGHLARPDRELADDQKRSRVSSRSAAGANSRFRKASTKGSQFATRRRRVLVYRTGRRTATVQQRDSGIGVISTAARSLSSSESGAWASKGARSLRCKTARF